MITPNPIVGTGLHAIGGVSASACYLPFQKTSKWSWNTFWLVQSFFAWVLMPALIGYLTVPGFFSILLHAPSGPFWSAFWLGAAYGFGGMSFGLAIGFIGYSLTYTLAIGISAILGTILPLTIFGGLVEHFTKPGGMIVLSGMVLSVAGLIICGWAGFKKERDILELDGKSSSFNMAKGLMLVLVAGALSAVYNISLEAGQPIADIAAKNGAGEFQGNAKLIISTSGCYLVNLIWFLIMSIKQGNLTEFTGNSGISISLRMKNFFWSAFAGVLWCCQFFFYGLGHVKMGHFKFASWVIHMSMLIFFSFIVGLIMKEWKQVKKNTLILLILALLIMVISYVIMTYGSMVGESILSSRK